MAEKMQECMMTLILPIHTVSESNVHTHWRKRHHRAKTQRTAMYYRCLATWRTPPALPLRITLTRIAPRALDDDNLAASCKALRDGVADWLAGAYGTGNDRQEGLRWHYAQRKGMPHEYAVEVSILVHAIPQNTQKGKTDE